MSVGKPLSGQVAFVTGASRGIGRAIALHLAREGADVALGGRDLDALAAVVAEVEAIGALGFGLRFDVTDTAAIPALVAEIEAALGPIDILVNNAGINRLRLALDVTEEDWDRVVDTNLRGAFFVAQAVGRGMVARGRGRIVNVASMAAFKAVQERSAYNSSKAGLVHLTKTLAVEWGPAGVRVNAVAPTFVETDLAAQWLDRPGFRERIVSSLPIRRLPSEDEVAAAVGYLVSAAADAINGITLPVDGGAGAT
ncbi:MAG: glucose 1-dehydrogenase [Chloroflexi bacterium]|nr:glucose 1-dehydrogenase [Chloroflexota bacterium]